MSGASLWIGERIDDRDVQRAIRQVIDRAERPIAFFKNVGEHLVNSTHARFDTQTAPDGTPWAPLKKATLDRKRVKKILTETSGLKDSIIYAARNNGLRVGTVKIYAAPHQFGFKGSVKVGAHKATRTKVFGRQLPFPVWAEVRAHEVNQDIPARPFLGISSSDRGEILEMAEHFLKG